MLIVGGVFEVDPDQREEFIASRVALMSASRAEAGCLEYVFSADPVEPSRVVLYERWESQDALDAHLAGMRATPPSTGSVAPTSAAVKIYDIEGERALG